MSRKILHAPAAVSQVSPGPARAGSLLGNWNARFSMWSSEHLASHSSCLIKHHHGLFYYSQGSSTSSAPFLPGLSNRRPTTLSLPSSPIHARLVTATHALAVCSACFHRHSAPLPLGPSPSFRAFIGVVSKSSACNPPSQPLFRPPNMAATQQLSMQSRTGRVNQRKCAHETSKMSFELSPLCWKRVRNRRLQ